MCSVARVCVRACGGCYPRRAIIQGSLSAQASKSVRDYVQMMDSSLWLVDLAGIFTRCHYRDDAHERLMLWSHLFKPACLSAQCVLSFFFSFSLSSLTPSSSSMTLSICVCVYVCVLFPVSAWVFFAVKIY